MDQYWIMGVLCFLVIGFYHDNLSETAGRKFSCFISLWAFITIGKSILLYLVQNDGNVTYTYPEVVDQDDPASGNRCRLMHLAAVRAGKR